MNDIGTVIGKRYTVGEAIGAGGMGEVYKGVDTLTNTTIAIKFLRREIIDSSPQIVERFIREADALRLLNHPNIVKVYETIEEDGKLFLILEYVSGGDLRQLLLKEKRLSIERVIDIALDITDALTRVHRLDIVHRDIKPANVLIAEDGTIRLTDFGIARMLREQQLTASGVMMGTLDYISPEALEGERLDTRADIWSMGVMLYELLTGQKPFHGDSLPQIVTAITQTPLPDIREIRSDCPFELVDLVQRMLVKDPNKRINTIRRVGLELEELTKRGQSSKKSAQQEIIAEVSHERTSVIMTSPVVSKNAIEQLMPQPFEWCAIPPGFVEIGDDSSQNPPGTVGGRYKVLAYSISKFPITNAQFQVFVDSDDGYKQSDWWSFSSAAQQWRQHYPRPNNSSFSGNNLPRTNVSWFEAVAFCLWLSQKTDMDITLPTEQQWQRAAQGDDKRRFPWGNDFDASRCNTNSRGTSPVTEFENGQSPFGVMDMSGNVLEWCRSVWGNEENRLDMGNRRVLRGGSWYRGRIEELEVSFRTWNHPDFRTDNRGFRIVLLS